MLTALKKMWADFMEMFKGFFQCHVLANFLFFFFYLYCWFLEKNRAI